VPPREPGDEDDLLIRADKSPNTRGAELIGLAPGRGGLDGRAMLAAAAQRRLKLLWVFQHDLFASAWGDGEVRAALDGAEMVVFQGTNANAVSARAHLVLPSAAYAEREGTFTNFQGRVQRFRTAVEPLGEARPDWAVLGRLGQRLGLADPVASAERAEQVFAAVAAAVPAFADLSYRVLGDAGRGVRA
jgi:predicted molibdopterin-dependent oxidoreductase YjgC